MNRTISSWYGRFGNNLQQISNAIYYCMENNINFYCPEHEHINSFEINFGEDRDLHSDFYYFNSKYLSTCIVEQMNCHRSKLLQDYVVPHFKVNYNPNINTNTLVIHIRQGDIFSAFPHADYVQNPLWYFRQIIETYDDVLIVTEGNSLSRIVAELTKDPKVRLQSGSVMEDFYTIMNASNVVTSGVGTFAMSAVLCSVSIKNFYCTDLYLTNHLNPEMLKGPNIFRTELKEYIKIGQWKNTLEQREFMLNYKGEEYGRS
jgi:hypothetical protein